MGISDRWVRILLVGMKVDGDSVVVHGLRGRPSNRRIDGQTQARAVEFLKQPDWHDFGPTFASEQLGKRHNITASKETVRAWMMAAGLWKARSRKLGEAHFWRPRRSGWRAGSVGYIQSRLAGGARRSGALSGAGDRRCHQPERRTLRSKGPKTKTGDHAFLVIAVSL
jgi:hypothetical protein